MKVILKKDVKNLGKKGELVNASNGYARNYLFPNGLAMEASASAMNELKNRESAEKFHKAEELKAAKECAEKLEGKTFKLAARAGANGRLFGSVTAKDVAEKIKEDLGIEADKRKISMDDIKQFGTTEAEVKIYQGVSAKIYVQVTEA